MNTNISSPGDSTEHSLPLPAAGSTPAPRSTVSSTPTLAVGGSRLWRVLYLYSLRERKRLSGVETSIETTERVPRVEAIGPAVTPASKERAKEKQREVDSRCEWE